jgi:predicted nucleotidyltransferase
MSAMKKKSAEKMNKDEILEILRRFKEINADKYKIDSLGLFGSGVRDNRNKKSDIDVVVVLSKLDALNLIGIKQELEEQFRCHVDVVRYREKMNPFLRKRIESEAVYV